MIIQGVDMKSNFEFTLKGKDWCVPFFVFWVLFIIFYIPMLVLPSRLSTDAQSASYISLLLSGLFLLMLVFVYPAFIILVLRIIMSKLSIRGKAFSFKGKISTLLGIILKGTLLSIITLTIYQPWFIRNYFAYLVSEISYDEEHPFFMGKGGRLFKYILLSVTLPVIALIALLLFLSFNDSSREGTGNSFAVKIAIIIYSFVFLMFIPFIYLLYKWYVNIQWRNKKIYLTAKFWNTCGYMLGQVLLTVISVGIYFPAAYLKTFRYFINRIRVIDGETKEGTFGFEGPVKKGFLLIWGQTLLSIITVGFYLPWAYAKVGTFVASFTYYDDKVKGIESTETASLIE
jgi:uncharacterized membrane protein YjgN (DUF898 family)